MKLRPYIDKELEELLHVILTSEKERDPSKLDLDVDKDKDQYDSISDENQYTINQKLDEFGNYRHRVEVQSTSIQSIHESVDNCVIYHTNKHLSEIIHKDVT